ncbi:hypothetical protein AMECASPLE_013054 [Ameca splendens]|uniref:Uncharacterized protein n=1 Tax=Ameca splendens TaxID=208324 RepID=A0ABV0YPG3_9TELE
MGNKIIQTNLGSCEKVTAPLIQIVILLHPGLITAFRIKRSFKSLLTEPDSMKWAKRDLKKQESNWSKSYSKTKTTTKKTDHKRLSHICQQYLEVLQDFWEDILWTGNTNVDLF